GPGWPRLRVSGGWRRRCRVADDPDQRDPGPASVAPSAGRRCRPPGRLVVRGAARAHRPAGPDFPRPAATPGADPPAAAPVRGRAGVGAGPPHARAGSSTVGTRRPRPLTLSERGGRRPPRRRISPGALHQVSEGPRSIRATLFAVIPHGSAP